MKKSEQEALYILAAYCSRGERCLFDIKKKLQTWQLEKECQERIIEKLQKENFFDEERYCKSFVNDKFKYNKWGKNKIEAELRKKNISPGKYKPFIDALDEEEVILQIKSIIDKKITTIKANTEYERNTKLIRFLIGKGFEMTLVLKVVNLNSEENELDFD